MRSITCTVLERGRGGGVRGGLAFLSFQLYPWMALHIQNNNNNNNTFLHFSMLEFVRAAILLGTHMCKAGKNHYNQL